MVRRLAQLYVGLALYGLGIALQVASGLGNDPWDTLHQGLARQTGLSIGTWIIIAAVAVMALWIPLRQRPGIGTISNAVLVGAFADLFLWALPHPGTVVAQWAYLVAAILIGGFATGCYIGAGLGPGPRDGLTTGLAARGHSIRVVRTGIELTVLVVGWLLGGTVGIGTLLYAVAIGPLTHVFIPRLEIKKAPREETRRAAARQRPEGEGRAPVPAAAVPAECGDAR
ncbi:membrane protein [Actinoallomurus liliacearum]|uniref:Membrane protein n=2 Tax=Actinoallomurus liliacearum TaxID=1080073 RepID=A0ABP8TBQ4_9ACTN